MKNKISSILQTTLEEVIDEEFLLQEIKDKQEKFEIISNVDSITLVSILVNLEEEIQDHFDVHITIASERAMSKRGPFSNVENLANFVVELVKEQI